MKTKLSIITPVLNRKNFINVLMEKVQKQITPEVEHVIIDGASTDGTLEIISRYNKNVVLVSQKDNSCLEAIEKAFKLARGEFIVFINSDEYPEDDFIANALSAINLNKSIEVFSFYTKYFKKEDQEYQLIKDNGGIRVCLNFEHLFIDEKIHLESLLFHRKFIHIFDLTMKDPVLSDMKMLAQLVLEKPSFLCIPKYGTNIICHENAISASCNFKERLQVIDNLILFQESLVEPAKSINEENTILKAIYFNRVHLIIRYFTLGLWGKSWFHLQKIHSFKYFELSILNQIKLIKYSILFRTRSFFSKLKHI